MGGRHKNFEDLMLAARDMTWAIFESGHFYRSTLYHYTNRALQKIVQYVRGCVSGNKNVFQGGIGIIFIFIKITKGWT